MTRGAKTYIYGVIGAGGMVLAYSLAGYSPAHPGLWAIFTVLTVLASIVKLRLPGMEGTFSLNFLFLLYGVAHFSLAETLIAGCVAAVAQSVLNAKKRPSPLQVLFNCANLTVSVGACFLIVRGWRIAGMANYLPAVMALVACSYFLVNTVLVSGVLSLLQDKPLGELCREWYVWSFPYYLLGVAVVGMLPGPGYSVSGEAWLVLLPMLYLVHFFLGLAGWNGPSASVGEQPNGSLPGAARIFIAAVVAACAIVLTTAAIEWQSENPARFAIYLALAVLASTFKIVLPRMRGSITPAFVLTLAAIAQFSFAETAVMALAIGVVQVLWRPVRRPMAAQVLFNPSCLVLSASIAWLVSRVVLEPWLGNSTAGVLGVCTLVLFGANTLMVAAVLALVDRKPLSTVWQLCYFWALPYYLVGAAAAGLMTAISRVADWPSSLLVLPLMALVYFSYRAHLSRAAVWTAQPHEPLAVSG